MLPLEQSHYLVLPMVWFFYSNRSSCRSTCIYMLYFQAFLNQTANFWIETMPWYSLEHAGSLFPFDLFLVLSWTIFHINFFFIQLTILWYIPQHRDIHESKQQHQKSVKIEKIRTTSIHSLRQRKCSFKMATALLWLVHSNSLFVVATNQFKLVWKKFAANLLEIDGLCRKIARTNGLCRKLQELIDFAKTLQELIDFAEKLQDSLQINCSWLQFNCQLCGNWICLLQACCIFATSLLQSFPFCKQMTKKI